MAHKHLHELLEEDQEPFLLKNYIADRRTLLKRANSTTTLRIKKHTPIVDGSAATRNLCRQACFFSYHDSPDARKLPFLDFPSPAKSPCGSPNAVFLHVPARTAALLLEAAMRVQKKSSSSKPKTQTKNGLLGTIWKRLSNRNRSRKLEINGVSVKGASAGPGKLTGKSEKAQETVVNVYDKNASGMGLSGSCNDSRRDSTVWSESNEEKSLDLETSSSCRSEDSEQIELASKERVHGGFFSSGKRFYPNPFTQQKSPSSGDRQSDFLPSTASPNCLRKEEKEKYEGKSTQKFQEEEGKEQCSPVSILEPPFQDDEKGNECSDKEDSYGLQCSFAVVERTKLQLLNKLHRFEKLAGLDPIELEKRMFEGQENRQDEDEDEDEDVVEEENREDDVSLTLCREVENVDGLISEVLRKSSLHDSKVSTDMKRLVSDLIEEEKKEQYGPDNSEVLVKRVCKRLGSWKEVESNTINMMVELDLRRELEAWKKNQEQVREMVVEIELAIYGLLVEELSQELSPYWNL